MTPVQLTDKRFLIDLRAILKTIKSQELEMIPQTQTE